MYLVGDDPGQAARARRLIDNKDVFVCTTVLLEIEWALRSVYGFMRAAGGILRSSSPTTAPQRMGLVCGLAQISPALALPHRPLPS